MNSGIGTRTIVVLLGVPALAVGCAQGESLETGYDTEVALGSDDGMLVDGYRWCMRSVGATINVPPPADDPPVEDPNDGDQAPKGCFCASAEEHAALDLLDDDNDWSVVVLDGTTPDLDQLRNSIRFEAYSHCDAVAEMQSGGMFPHNCDDVLTDADPLFLENVPPSEPECMAPERIGTGAGMEPPPSDHYWTYYSLSSAIVYNSGQNKYYIDDAFFYDMLESPGWLLDDAARIVADSGSPPYRFDIPGTSGVAYKLGIRNNDRPISINGYTLVGGMLDAVVAANALIHSTTFTFVVKRGTSNVTLQYVVQ